MAKLVTGIDPDLACKPAVDLKHRNDACASVDGRLIKGHSILVDTRHDARCIQKYHVERNERVLHPERRVLGAFVDEKHTPAGGHLFDMHQTLGAFAGFIGHINREPCRTEIPAQLDRVFAARRNGVACEEHKGGRDR